MSDKKPYEKPKLTHIRPYEEPELTHVRPSDVIAELLRGQQAMIDSVSAIGSLVQNQAKEIKALQDRVSELEGKDDTVQ